MTIEAMTAKLRCALAAAVVAGTALAGAGAARALEIRSVTSADAAITRVELSGAFERGDAQRVQAHLARMPAGTRIVVDLNSTGGSVDEALRIGRHLHANRIATAVIGPDRQCLSACALTFLAGRDASGQPHRIKGRSAEIGFHGFRRIVADKEFTVADMHEAIAGTQQALLAIADYLIAVEADIEFMSMMLEKPASGMSWLSNDKATTLGVRVVE